MKFRVYGTTVVNVTIEVEADNEAAAIEAAYQEFGGLTGYAGNGGMGKLVGTSDQNVSLDPDDHVEFTEAEQS
jgi:hypothetical protein